MLSYLGFGKKEKAFANLQTRLQQNKNQLKPNNYGHLPHIPVVPKLSMNKDGIGQNEYVTLNNGKRNIRAEVFEQNFIRRIYTSFYNAILTEDTIRLDSYKEKLNSAVSEEEAILYYDELIAVMNMVILYAMYHRYHALDNDELDETTKEHGRQLIKKVDEDIDLIKKKNIKALAFAAKGLLSDTIKSGLTAAYFTAALINIGGGMGIATGTLTAILITPIIFISVYDAYSYDKKSVKYVNYFRFKQKGAQMYEIVKEIHKILFAERPHMFKKLVQEEKIKFWGMSQLQVDLLLKYDDVDLPLGYINFNGYSSNWNNTFFKEFLQAYGKEPFAPNEPFSRKVMDVELRITNTNITNAYTPNQNRNARNAAFLNDYRRERKSELQNKLLENVYSNVPSEENIYGNLKGGRRTRRRNTRRRKSMRRR